MTSGHVGSVVGDESERQQRTLERLYAGIQNTWGRAEMQERGVGAGAARIRSAVPSLADKLLE
jgi:hypothetical protein